MVNVGKENNGQSSYESHEKMIVEVSMTTKWVFGMTFKLFFSFGSVQVTQKPKSTKKAKK